MSPRLSLPIILLVLATAGSAQAFDFDFLFRSKDSCCASKQPCGCADDYCRKALPKAPCAAHKGCFDDYCRKRLPKAPCRSCCGLWDDYCNKPLPNLCWQPMWQFYRCPPGCSDVTTPCGKCKATRAK